MPRAVVLSLCLVLLAAAPAAAQHSAVATPDLTNAGTHVRLTLDGTQPPVDGRVPRGLTLAARRGFRFDPKAVKGRCDLQQARAEGCPADSRIGTGFADVTATSPLFGTFDIRAQIETFLGDRENRKGELAGVITTLNVMGTETVARGRVEVPASGPYGLRVVYDELPATPGGFTVTLRRFETEFGAQRTITRTRRVKGKRRKVKERHVLTRTPRTCTTGSWAGHATLRFDDGSIAEIDAPFSCRPRD